MKSQFEMLFLLLLLIVISRSSPGLTLEEYLSHVEKENLEIKLASAQAEAAEARSFGINVPPPMFGLTKIKFDSGETASGFEITQNLPFPSKIAKEYDVRRLDAAAAKEISLAGQAEVLAGARKAYLNFWRFTQEQKILEEKKLILLEHLKIAQSQVRSDSSMKLHFLKAESDLDDLSSESLMLEEKINTSRIQMNLFRNQTPEAKIIDISDPPLEEIPAVLSNAQNHFLKALEIQTEMSFQRESLAKQSWFPNFNFRYKETTATSMSPKNSELMLGMDLPFLFFWQPQAEAKSATAERMKAEVELQKQRTLYRSTIAELQAKATRIRKQLDLISQRLLPRANQREKLVHHISPRDMEALQDHRETLEAGPDLKLKRISLISEYEEIVSELQKLTRNLDPTHE